MPRMSIVCALVVLVGYLVSAPTVAFAEKRVALVIGNDQYETLSPLKNAGNDARAIAGALRDMNFEVIEALNVGRTGFFRKRSEFRSKLRNADVALVYYAGHGIQSGSVNWLIPSDAEVHIEADLEAWGIDAQDLLAMMQFEGTTVNILILDACRDNPLPKRIQTRSAARGLRQLDMSGVEQSVVVMYAAAPGQTALDGPENGNGVFTAALLHSMQQEGATLEQVFKTTTAKVIQDTDGAQRPWREGSIPYDFYFVPKGSKVTIEPQPRPQPGAPVNMEALFWQSIQGSDRKEDFEAYLAQFPDGTFARLAEVRVAALSVDPEEPELVEAQPGGPDPDTVMWETVESYGSERAYEAYLEQYPDGIYAGAARVKIAAIAKDREKREAEAKKQAQEALRKKAEAEALATVDQIPDVVIQIALKDLGLYTGSLDGVMGRGSRAGISTFQGRLGNAKSGTLTPAETVALVRAAATAGKPLSQNSLGSMYAAGIGVPKDLGESIRWFEAAANQGDAYGLFNLGIMYRDGMGVAASRTKAKELFAKAKTKGHPQAAGELKKLGN